MQRFWLDDMNTSLPGLKYWSPLFFTISLAWFALNSLYQSSFACVINMFDYFLVMQPWPCVIGIALLVGHMSFSCINIIFAKVKLDQWTFKKTIFLVLGTYHKFEMVFFKNLIVEKKSSRCNFKSIFMQIRFLWSRIQNISFNDRMHFDILSKCLLGLWERKLPQNLAFNSSNEFCLANLVRQGPKGNFGFQKENILLMSY